jgi:hypothetical protein
VIEHLDAIEQWRNGLSEERRRRMNYPAACWHNFRRDTECKPSRNAVDKDLRRKLSEEPKTSTSARPVYWSEAHLRRAHRAMLDSRSSDLMTLARRALEGAIRDQDDLAALLDGMPKWPVSASAKKAIAAPIAEHATA